MARLVTALFVFLCSPPLHADPVTLNLKNADINALIGTVAQVTGRNFVVDPRVKGRVTVISSAPMESEELYQVFLSILRVHGFSAVPNGKLVKIVPNVNAIQDAIDTETDGQPSGEGDQLVTRVVAVENVDAAQLVPILRPLMPQQGQLAAVPGANTLVISDHAANIQRLVTIIQRIDVRSNENDVEVVRLSNARAPEVVRILSALVQKSGGADAAQGNVFVADERTNSVLLGGPESLRLKLRTFISHLDTPLEESGATQVIYLHYAQAANLATVLQGVAEQEKSQQGGEAVKIQADENTNALVISAEPAVMRSLKEVVRQLDIRRAQVLVEGVIAELSHTKAVELGVQWRSGTSAINGNGVLGGTVFPGTSSGSINGFPDTSVTLGSGLTLGLFQGGSVRALIRALATDGETNILSTPSLVTLDNEEAEIHVGQNVPFVTGQYTSTSTTPDNPFQTIERRDVGIKLKVKPQVNEGDAVKLEISQEVSSVDRDTTGANLITNTRTVSTKVLVNDGQVVVLGGLIRDDLQESVQKVPLLGDVPVLGALFRNKRADYVKRNLMIFLRPVILRDQAVTNRVSQGKYTYIRALQIDNARQGSSVIQEAVPPVLNDLSAYTGTPEGEVRAPVEKPKVEAPPSPWRGAEGTIFGWDGERW